MSKDLKGVREIICASMKTFLANTKDIIFIKNTDFIYLDGSQPFADLAGFSAVADLVGKTDFEIFKNQELARRYREDDMRMLAAGKHLPEYVEPIPSTDEGSKYCITSKYIITNEKGKTIGLMGVSRDITREYEAKLNYERELGYLFDFPADALFTVLFDITSWRIVDFRMRDENNHIVSQYDTIDNFMSNAAASVIEDENVRHFFAAFSKESVKKTFDSGKRRLSMKYRRKMADGTALWVHEELYFLTDPISRHLSVFFTLHDISIDKQRQEALLHAAERDSLTGLFNHDSVMKKISECLGQNEPDSTSALFMLDIDNFKTVNDTLGHKTGDRILREISDILRNSFRDTDVLGRIGGDEFFAFMKNAANTSTISKKAENLIESLQKNYSTEGFAVGLSCSIGISLITKGSKSLETLYDEADAALYEAKARGKNQFVIYDKKMDKRR